MGEAVRDVVDDIAGNFDPKLGSILHLVDLVQRLIHRIFEVFQVFALLFVHGVHDVPFE